MTLRASQSVFVGNLSYFCTQEHLWNLLAPFGGIRSVKICKTKDNKDPLYYGFVHLTSASAVDAAVKGLSGKLFMGRKLRVSNGEKKLSHLADDSAALEHDTDDSGACGTLSEPNRDSTVTPSDSNPQQTHISQKKQVRQPTQVLFSFVSTQIHPLVDESVLHAVFSSFGKVEDVVVKSHEISHVSPDLRKQGGYGFVLFVEETSALRAIAVLSRENYHYFVSNDTAATTTEGDDDANTDKNTDIHKNACSMDIHFDCKLSRVALEKLSQQHERQRPVTLPHHDNGTKRRTNTDTSRAIKASTTLSAPPRPFPSLQVHIPPPHPHLFASSAPPLPYNLPNATSNTPYITTQTPPSFTSAATPTTYYHPYAATPPAVSSSVAHLLNGTSSFDHPHLINSISSNNTSHKNINVNTVDNGTSGTPRHTEQASSSPMHYHTNNTAHAVANTDTGGAMGVSLPQLAPLSIPPYAMGVSQGVSPLNSHNNTTTNSNMIYLHNSPYHYYAYAPHHHPPTYSHNMTASQSNSSSGTSSLHVTPTHYNNTSSSNNNFNNNVHHIHNTALLPTPPASLYYHLPVSPPPPYSTSSSPPHHVPATLPVNVNVPVNMPMAFGPPYPHQIHCHPSTHNTDHSTPRRFQSEPSPSSAHVHH